MKSEKLGIQFKESKKGAKWEKWEGWYRPYHAILIKWCHHFGLNGAGLVIGEEGQGGQNTKELFEETFSVKAYTVGLANADIVWDITTPLQTNKKYNWIMCQATLEHVTDPVAAIKNMAKLLNVGGRLYLHTVGPEFPLHRRPLDCYRYFRDALIAFAELANLEIDDICYTKSHCFAVYRRK